jgi:hypothetical protein
MTILRSGFQTKLEEEPTPVLANFCAMTSDEDLAKAISEVAIRMGCSAVLDKQAGADTLKGILLPKSAARGKEKARSRFRNSRAWPTSPCRQAGVRAEMYGDQPLREEAL